MKALLALTLTLALTGPAFGGRRRVVAPSPAADEIKIVFTGVAGSGSDALVDAGSTTQPRSNDVHGTKRYTKIRRRFGVRLEATGSSEGATAALRAYLESHDGRSSIRIDGITLDTTPKLIHAHVSIGTVTQHTLEIEVPTDISEGAFASAVRWDVSTN